MIRELERAGVPVGNVWLMYSRALDLPISAGEISPPRNRAARIWGGRRIWKGRALGEAELVGPRGRAAARARGRVGWKRWNRRRGLAGVDCCSAVQQVAFS
jgi:hypothetical protein